MINQVEGLMEITENGSYSCSIPVRMQSHECNIPMRAIVVFHLGTVPNSTTLARTAGLMYCLTTESNRCQGDRALMLIYVANWFLFGNWSDVGILPQADKNVSNWLCKQVSILFEKPAWHSVRSHCLRRIQR